MGSSIIDLFRRLFTTRNRAVTLTIIWMTFVPVLSSTIISVLLLKQEQFFQSFFGQQWILFYAITSVTMAFALTPTTFIAIVSGYFLGFNGLLPMIISYQIASIIGYYTSRIMDQNYISDLVTEYPNGGKILDGLHQNQWTVIILSRISPAFPFALMNVVLSLSRVRFMPYFWAGLIGMLPRSIFFLWLGYSTARLYDALHDQQHLIYAILITFLVGVVLYKILKPRN